MKSTQKTVRHTIKVSRRAKRASVATLPAQEVCAGVKTAVHKAVKSFEVVVEYGERNTRSLSFAASRGLKELKKHIVNTVGKNWCRALVEMPSGQKAVLRNPKVARVLSSS